MDDNWQIGTPPYSEDTDSDNDFATIRAAINSSNPGDTVRVSAGLYNEQLSIDKTLMIIGDGMVDTIINGTGNGDVVHITANSVHITGFTLRNSGTGWGDTGIELSNTKNCNIANNLITDNYQGILFLYSTGGNTITHNRITSNSADGIYLTHSDNNLITKNNLLENGDGIQILESYNNVIDNNTILSNIADGIYLDLSSNNEVTNNTVSYNNDGIYLRSSTNNIIAKNIIFGNEDGIELTDSSDDVILGNHVLNNKHGIYLKSSTNNEITRNNALHCKYGIRVWYSNSNIISNNNALENEEVGVKISFSEGTWIVNNTFASNIDDGASLDSSNNNQITNNLVLGNCDDGIELLYSLNNRIANNTISLNTDYGLLFTSSNHNWIYHNNFIDNRRQIFDNTETNQWDNGYPSGGNYWTDYTGDDAKSGSKQDLYGGDGIGDSPYEILGGESKDQYPLIDPFKPTIFPNANKPPYCSIANLKSGITIKGIHTVTGSASDSDGTVERVEIRIDNGEWIRALRTTSWSYELNTTTLTDGEHKMYVHSYDGMDYSEEVFVSINVDNSIPQDVDNSTPQESVLEQTWCWLLIIVIIIVIIIMLFFLYPRKTPPNKKIRSTKKPTTRKTTPRKHIKRKIKSKKPTHKTKTTTDDGEKQPEKNMKEKDGNKEVEDKYNEEETEEKHEGEVIAKGNQIDGAEIDVPK